jgi:hypothetical protein
VRVVGEFERMWQRRVGAFSANGNPPGSAITSAGGCVDVQRDAICSAPGTGIQEADLQRVVQISATAWSK